MTEDIHVYNEKFQYCETCGRESEICPCCGAAFPPHELFEAPEGEPAAVYCTPCWETLFCESHGHCQEVLRHVGPYSARVVDARTIMNSAQEARLRLLCKRYGVRFNATDYHPATLQATGMMFGWVEGWIGGKPGTLYVGVSPAGESHS